MTRPLPCALALVPLFCSASVAADTLAEGYLANGVPRPPGEIGTLPDGNFVGFDGETVTLYGSSGAALFTLATFAGTDFPTFVRIDPSAGFALVGESLGGTIWRVPVDPFSGESPALVATLQFHYDASFLDGDTLYVSADHDGMVGNEIYRLELDPPDFEQVAALPGFSGPLVVGPGGDLFYGTAEFPVPPGGARVLRFGAAALTSGALLQESDATLVGAGFPGASSLAWEPAAGDLYLAASDFVSGVNEVRRVEGDASGSPLVAAGEPFDFLSNLELFPADDPRVALRPWQPDGGPRLRYSGLATRQEVSALRPQATLTGPGASGPGPFDVDLADAPPLGSAFVLYGPTASVPPAELAVFLASQGLNVFLGLGPAELEFDPLPIPLDGQGLGTRGYVNPGGLNGIVSIQLLALRADGTIAGTSDVLGL